RAGGLNYDEPVRVESRDVAGDIPSVGCDDLAGLFRVIEVARHDAGAFDDEHPFLIGAEGLERIRIHNIDAHTRDGQTDRAALVTHLVLPAPHVALRLDGDHG